METGGIKSEPLVLEGRDGGHFELRSVLAAPAIQSLMDDFSALTGMATAILDLKGEILVTSGWQELCTRFHRVHPDTAANCTKSDLFLAANVKPGEHVGYKCLNQLWDVVTPLLIEGQHVGNVYTGQFFYEDEPVEIQAFIAQAKRYGFDTEAYLAALGRVPRVGREKVKRTMDYLVKFAGMVSEICLSNLKLSRAAAELHSLAKFPAEAPNPVFRILQDGTVVHPNPASRPLLETWGCGQEWKLSGNWLRLATEALASGRPTQAETRCGECAYSLTFAPSPDLGYVNVYAMDITQLKASEQLLAQERNRLEVTLRSIGDGVVATDIEGKVTMLNKVASALTGWSSEDAAGKPLSEVFHVVDTLSREPRANPVGQALRDGETVSLGERSTLVAKDGSEHQIADSAAAICGDGGDVYGAVLVFRDVTEDFRLRHALDRAKDYIDNIINSMPSVLVTVDGEGRVTQWNNAAEEQTGSGAANAMGRRLEEVFPRLAADMVAIKRAIRERSVEKRHDVARQERGEIRYDDITIYPLVTNGVEGAVIRVDDKTEQKRLEDMMIQSEKMLSLGGLAAGMAHEINNPLAGIVQGVQNLKRRLLADLPANREAAMRAGLSLECLSLYIRERHVDQMVDDIMAGCVRAAEIVNNMLGFARKDSGGGEPCSLAALLDKTVELAANDFDLKGKYDFRHMEIVRDYQADTPPVRCEPSKIQQVFLNILKNAAAAMNDKQYRSGGPRFVLRVRPAGGMARVEIEDNGSGMDKATQKRVFEPFFTTRAVGSGTGLGMSVSYFIIKNQHHGEMLVESEPGKGTKFVVELPLGDEAPR